MQDCAMFTIRLLTQSYRPDVLITLRTSADWDRDVAGVYDHDAWSYVLSEADFLDGQFAFKFVLDRTAWMEGDNLRADAVAGTVIDIAEGEVAFPPNEELIAENPYLQRWLFAPNFDEGEAYDVVIVGSGMGGGILADQLSDQGADVLVLEAGSYLFPTHVGNLPRRQSLGHFDKHLWNLYEDFKVKNYQQGTEFRGGQAFSLGGRSVFWGGLIPRMSRWELDLWPPAVRGYLEGPGYQRAEDLLNRTAPPASTYHQVVRQFLRAQLPQFDHLDAPMAVDYRPPASALLASGVFSTADLLTESRLTPGATGQEHLQVNLNHPVTRLETNDGTVTGAVAYDLIANRERTFHGATYVLAAGTIESAKLTQLSLLNDPTGKSGFGFTDHPVMFMHFALPANAPLYRASDSSKTLSHHRQASLDAHPYNLILELGADLNQGRYVDDNIYATHVAARGEKMLCELVFLLNARLVDTNRVLQRGPSYVKPVLTIQRAEIEAGLHDEMQDLADGLVGELGGVALPGEDLELKLADLGGVAHEVGTLRMADDGSGVVDENLRFLSYDNLYACDLSVFPSSPAANPSLTLAALAIRLADQLSA
jgi:choline dehydrogenase-like flavoprotein